METKVFTCRLFRETVQVIDNEAGNALDTIKNTEYIEVQLLFTEHDFGNSELWFTSKEYKGPWQVVDLVFNKGLTEKYGKLKENE